MFVVFCITAERRRKISHPNPEVTFAPETASQTVSAGMYFITYVLCIMSCIMYMQNELLNKTNSPKQALREGISLLRSNCQAPFTMLYLSYNNLFLLSV